MRLANRGGTMYRRRVCLLDGGFGSLASTGPQARRTGVFADGGPLSRGRRYALTTHRSERDLW